jgi:uncharacterized membrane protein (UPF0182 family)
MYIQTYEIIGRALITPIFIMRWNVHFIPLCLIALITLFSVWFYRKKQFSKIRLWYILLILIFMTIVNIICIPEFYVATNEEYNKQIPMIHKYINYCRVIFTLIFIVIAYIKYFKIGRDEKIG